MFAIEMSAILPPQASEFAAGYDLFFWYITAVIVGGAAVVFAMLAGFSYLYARRTPTDKTPRILGSTKVEVIWTVIPFLFFMSFFVIGVRLYNEQVKIPPDAPEYFVAGKQWMWKMQHPDGVREIDELHLPICDERDASGTLTEPGVKITATSEDVIHDFGVPAFRSKIDVIPGRYSQAWYQPTKLGEYHIYCDQYCGTWHSLMVGKIKVVGEGEFDEWLMGHTPLQGTVNPVDGSLGHEGRQLFLKLQCINCHSATPTGKAPVLEGLYGTRVPLKGGGAEVADDTYIIESIRRPRLKVVDGWEAVMPAYDESQVSAEELNALVAYIRSLKKGTTPDRTDRFPAPNGAPTERTQSTDGGKK